MYVAIFFAMLKRKTWKEDQVALLADLFEVLIGGGDITKSWKHSSKHRATFAIHVTALLNTCLTLQRMYILKGRFLCQENAAVLEDEACVKVTLEKKRRVKRMISERVSALPGPNWTVESVMAKIK